MRERGLKQRVGADDVGVDEVRRRVDGTVDVAFGGEMHHGVRVELGKEFRDGRTVADVGAAELVARVISGRTASEARLPA